MVALVEALGLAAGFLVSLGLVPQILRIWRLRDAQEISLPFNLLSLGGTALWLMYGLVQGLISVILWNGVNCVLYLILLSVKLKYGMGRGRLSHSTGFNTQSYDDRLSFLTTKKGEEAAPAYLLSSTRYCFTLAATSTSAESPPLS